MRKENVYVITTERREKEGITSKDKLFKRALGVC